MGISTKQQYVSVQLEIVQTLLWLGFFDGNNFNGNANAFYHLLEFVFYITISEYLESTITRTTPQIYWCTITKR